MIDIIQDIIPIGKKSRPQNIIKPKYITIHETGNRKIGAGAKNHANYLKNTTSEVSWHFTVDDTYIIQHLPLNENGWHAGDGRGQGNMSSIGIEICVNPDSNFEKAKENAQKLIARLLHELDLNINAVVQHNHWTGKNCPETIRSEPNGWAIFINKVIAYYDGATATGNGATATGNGEVKTMASDTNRNVPNDWAREALEWAVNNGIIYGDENGNLGLDNPCTREQMVVFLHRLYKKLK